MNAASLLLSLLLSSFAAPREFYRCTEQGDEEEARFFFVGFWSHEFQSEHGINMEQRTNVVTHTIELSMFNEQHMRVALLHVYIFLRKNKEKEEEEH